MQADTGCINHCKLYPPPNVDSKAAKSCFNKIHPIKKDKCATDL